MECQKDFLFLGNPFIPKILPALHNYQDTASKASDNSRSFVKCLAVKKSNAGPHRLVLHFKNTQNGEQKMKDIKYIIADNVRFYRKKADLTQAGLAERAELSLDTIKRIEAGKRTMSLENFLGLSDALRIPLTFLLYEQKDRMPDEERIWGILKGRSDGQKEYLLHMLQEIADGIDRYL